MIPLFPNGIRGLSDSKRSGIEGSVHRIVGCDYRTDPGLIRVHQALAKHSPDSGANEVTELCKARVAVSDGSRLWFSAESGKVWREVSGTYSLIHTITEPAEPFSDPRKYAFFKRSEDQKWKIADSAQTGLDVASDLTIAVFVQFRSLPAAGEVHTILDKWNESGNQRAYRLVIERDGTDIMLRLWGSTNGESSGVSIMASAIPGAALGEWFHLAVVRDRNAFIKFYVNGALVATATDTLGDNSIFNSSADFAVGGSAVSTTLGFAGYLSDLRFWSRVLDATEISDLYDDPEAFSNGADLLGHWEFDNDGADESANNNDLSQNNSPTFRTFGETASYVIPSGAEEFRDYVYFATKEKLRRIAVEDLASWSGNVETFGFFEIAGDEHPMAKQNLSLFIGDGYVIAEVDDTETFVRQADFNVAETESIVALCPFDIDLLVGTRDVGFGRVLRWDTVSESWSAQDEVFDKEGGIAFIRDDNYVYVCTGHKGRISFYNGEKMEPFVRIPGDWIGKEAKVNPNAVAFLNGVPVFGLSNVSGNPALQGVYGLGGYGRGYPKTLSLDFPMPTDEFSGVEIGAIVVDGEDLYVSWKDGEDTGIAKLNYSAKYAGAYIETMLLADSKTRHQLKTITDCEVPYASLPANTAIALSYKKAYEANYTAFDTSTDTNRMVVYVKKATVPKVANPQLKVAFTVSGNNAPEIENLLFDLAPIGPK